jgi:AraC-like DNA-binding protein
MVPIYYIPQIAEQVAARGGDTAAWLAAVGLDAADLNDNAAQVPLETCSALVRSAIAVTGESALGLFVGRSLGPSVHGIVGHAVNSSPSIMEAMRVLERFFLLRTPVVSPRTEVSGGDLRVVLTVVSELDDMALPILEIALLAFKNIADQKVAAGSACTGVYFAFPAPAYARLAGDFCACRVQYGASWTGFTVPLEDAARRLPNHDALVFAEALRICQEELERLPVPASMAARLERLLMDRKGDFPSFELSARLLKVTPRTLHRRLFEENTSYQAALDGVRRQLAREYLQSKRISIKEAAYLLGYSDTANFRRAFKRWEGVAPSEALARYG